MPHFIVGVIELGALSVPDWLQGAGRVWCSHGLMGSLDGGSQAWSGFACLVGLVKAK